MAAASRLGLPAAEWRLALKPLRVMSVSCTWPARGSPLALARFQLLARPQVHTCAPWATCDGCEAVAAASSAAAAPIHSGGCRRPRRCFVVGQTGGQIVGIRSFLAASVMPSLKRLQVDQLSVLQHGAGVSEDHGEPCTSRDWGVLRQDWRWGIHSSVLLVL